MPATPERERHTPSSPKEVTEIPESPEVHEHIEKAGVSTRPSQFTAQVTDDSGNQLIQTPKTKSVTITLPATKEQLVDWSKGSTESSLTWLAKFWLRMIKKAVHFGWRIVTRKDRKDVAG